LASSQVFPFSAIQTLLSFASLLNETFTALGKQIPALPSPDWIPSGAQPPLGPSLGESAPSVNLRNAFNPDDASQTPLQFIYEAANCRLFYTYPDLQQVSSLWKRVYDTVWGNGTCVEGSTTSNNNIISKIANDTVPFSEKFLSNATNPFTGPGSLGGASGSGSPTTSGTGSTTSSGAQATGTKNGSGRLVSSGILLCVGLGFGFAFS
jgi:hypothetical protein